MPTTTLSVEERSARVSSLLHQVDADVRARNFNAALEKIRKVYDFDIKNMYARAYEDSILSMIVDTERKKVQKEAETKAAENIDLEVKRRVHEFYRQQEIEGRKRNELEKSDRVLEEKAREASRNEIQRDAAKDFSDIEWESKRRIEDLEKRLMEQIQRSLGALQKGMPGGLEGSDQARADYEAKLQQLKSDYEKAEAERRRIQEESFKELLDEQKRAQEEVVQHMEMEREASLRQQREKAKERFLESYRSLMMLMMELDLNQEYKRSILQSLKISFSISDSEHMEIERAVQLNTYVEAVKATWNKGKPSEEDCLHLKTLQGLYNISEEEDRGITKRVKKSLGLPDETAVILVIDDDPSIRKYLEHILTKTYLTVLSVPSAEQAIVELQRATPSVMLCDVNLGAGVMSGFTFYERLLAGTYGDALKEIPFVMMSALGDEFFIRSAKQMGIKAYLPKPMTRETVEAALREALA